MTIIHKVTPALLEITGVYLVLLQGHQMQKRCKTPNKSDELLKLLKILEIVWQKTWVEKRRRKAERKWNTINCSEERCVPLTNLCSCVQVCCSARSSTCVTLCIKQAKNGGICNVFVCCLSGGGEILVENSRRGVWKRFLKSLTLFQAKMCIFPNSIQTSPRLQERSDIKHTQCKSMVLENTKPYAMSDPKSKSLNLWPKFETKAVKHHNFGAKLPGLSRNGWLVWDEVKKSFPP